MKIVNITCRAILRKQILKVFFTVFDDSASAAFGALDKLELESTIQLFRFPSVFFSSFGCLEERGSNIV